MKKLLFLPALALAAFAAPHVSNVAVDPAASTVVWTGQKAKSQHTGTILVKNGNILLDHGKLVGSAFEIDMTSITSTGKGAAKLVKQLKSDGFFGSATYPTARFSSTSVTPLDMKGNYRIVGNLSIREKTSEVSFDANVSEANSRVTVTGKIPVIRSGSDQKHGSGSFFDGPSATYEAFDLMITLVSK